jgi:hypothetical protein
LWKELPEFVAEDQEVGVHLAELIKSFPIQIIYNFFHLTGQKPFLFFDLFSDYPVDVENGFGQITAIRVIPCWCSAESRNQLFSITITMQ